MTKRNSLVAALLVIAITTYLLYQQVPSLLSGARSAALQPALSQAQQEETFICPMHPEVSQHHPGTCPICGMKLVPSDQHEAHEHGVHVDNATIQTLGVRLASVTKSALGQDLQAYGNIVVDERTLYNVHTKYEGWIKKLYVHSVGERIKAGQVLYEIYSPDLIARERSYISNIDRRKQLLQTINTTPATESEYVMDLAMDAAKDRSKLHVEEGVSIETIQEMENTKQAPDVAKIVAGVSGVVTQLNVREGTFVPSATTLLTLADTAKAWVDIPLYPDQMALVNVGDPVTIRAPNGETIDAKLDFISPLADNNKVRARVYIDNTRFRLRPGAFADVTIKARPHQALALPQSAILHTAQGDTVMLCLGEGHFVPVPVETGVEDGERVEIVSGLKEGAEVAINGQFLLDAASSMNAAAERMHMH